MSPINFNFLRFSDFAYKSVIQIQVNRRYRTVRRTDGRGATLHSPDTSV